MKIQTMILPSIPRPYSRPGPSVSPNLQGRAGALPSRFRRQRVLIVGCGDVGLRVKAALPPRVRVLALTSSPERVQALRERGITPLQGNLDAAPSLRRLAGLGTRVLHLAPPPTEGLADVRRDPRTRALSQALARRGLPQALVYGSTSGVYGDCGGARIDESRPVRAATPRGQRRVDAEQQLRLQLDSIQACAAPVHCP